MKKVIADRLLESTQDNYNNFAESFSQTRNYFWPEISAIVKRYFSPGDKVLDIGCGNGRYYPLFNEKGANYFGIDNSKNLIAVAKRNFPKANLAMGDALSLPFAENYFDLVFSAAVLHHIPSKNYRQSFFKEAKRVLKPGGSLIVTVWDLRPSTMIKNKQWKRLKLFIKSQIKIIFGLEKLDFGDFSIPWQNKYQRYVHSFTLHNLEKLAISTGFSIEKSGVTNLGSKESNLYIILKKLHN